MPLHAIASLTMAWFACNPPGGNAPCEPAVPSADWSVAASNLSNLPAATVAPKTPQMPVEYIVSLYQGTRAALARTATS